MTLTDATKIDAAFAAYVRTYTGAEMVQPADQADTDPQLSSIGSLLGVELDRAPQGALIDIGCGAGTLLQRMSRKLLECPNWRYVPIEFEAQLAEIYPLATKLKLFSRILPMTVEAFGAEPVVVDGRKIYACRNVMHELRIDEAAHLIANVCRDFGPNDVFLIQDLAKLPKGERHHHCWLATLLREALKAIGFSTVSLDMQAWRTGMQWYNMHATGLARMPSFDQVRAALLTARREQWDIWARLAMPEDNLPKRAAPIEAVDLDLQFASLTRELKDEGLSVTMDAATQRRLRLNELVRRIEDLADGATPEGAAVASQIHFRERGRQLTQAEDFLRSVSRLALVYGGPGMGKTTFIEQVLANRLYEKILVRVDFRSARGVWPVLEHILSQLGLNLAADVLSALDDLAYNQVQAAIGRLLNRFAAQMVFIFENVDQALNSNLRFNDLQLLELLLQIAGKNGVKMILSSRSEYVPRELVKAAGDGVPVAIRVNRYASDDTVVNVLDDFFDRAGHGVESYPQTLISAIDKHPLIASLAGRILASEGKGLLRDEKFFRELQLKLRTELASRLIDDASAPAVEVAGELRVPVPASLLERLAPRESIHQARSNDVLYAIPDRRWTELMNSLGLFKKRGAIDTMPSAEERLGRNGVDHGRIADAYLAIYRVDDDPAWIRESHFHRMLEGDPSRMAAETSRYYRTELIASADYCFDRCRQYRTALDLYNAAARIEPLEESAAMWRASSMVRIPGLLKAGNAEYERLVRDYPGNIGMKRSHVDALLAVEQYEMAELKLAEYNLKAAQHDWHAQQWGRVRLGLHEYKEAIEIFTRLREKKPDDPFLVTYLARALQQFGDLNGAITVLETGHKDFPDNVSIATSLAANLERSRDQDSRAKDMLQKLFDANHANARAALSLVRLLRREGAVEAAQTVMRRVMEADVIRSMHPFIHMAQAELLMAQKRPEAAAAYIRDNLTDDESPGLFIEALLAAADHAQDQDVRDSFMREAAQVQVSDRLKHNVPVQIDRARLGARLGNRELFDEAIANLSETRIDPTELERLKAQFE